MGARQILKWLFVLGPAVVAALPAPVVADIPQQHSTVRSRLLLRQAAPPAAAPAAAAPAAGAAPPAAAPPTKGASGLSDTDILNFALTAEHLETAFYSQGFQKFPASDFKALGLSDANIAALQSVGQSEATHVSTLLSAISGAGVKPVEPCQYNFGFTTAQAMVATARVLEAVGVSAYLGAAPLINSSAVLTAAATIATVESRHQTFIRMAGGANPIPAAFDTPLGPRAVFTLAAQFIQSCPSGSNLNIQAFPAIALQNPAGATPGQNLVLQSTAAPAGAQFCAFIAPATTQFAQLNNGACTIPNGLSGEVYMMITRSQSIADSEVLAGPSVLQPS